jgi:hypothetical protein
MPKSAELIEEYKDILTASLAAEHLVPKVPLAEQGMGGNGISCPVFSHRHRSVPPFCRSAEE